MTHRATKRPAYQWYPGDFRRDTAVQSCSFEARALWREMLDLMHDGEPYGHLTAGGVPIAADLLARMVGKSVAVVKRWLAELESRKVFSRTDDGVIYSRRMVKDEHIRNVRAASGKLGGNPALLVNHPDKGEPPIEASKSKPLHLQLQSAVAELPGVGDYARALSTRANQGLREHPSGEPTVLGILPHSARSHEAAALIRDAGVPLDFAEAEVYELAKTHKAETTPASLRYFAPGVIRAWQRKEAGDAASGSDRPPTRPAAVVVDPFTAAVAQWAKENA